MKLSVENLGRVKKAEIDLSKDLIIFCGPNNTGKTYLANCIYGLYKVSQEIPVISASDENLGRQIWGESFGEELDLEALFTHIDSWYSKMVSSNLLDRLSNVFAAGEKTFVSTRISLSFNKNAVLEKIRKSAFSKSFKKNGDLTFSKEAGSSKMAWIYSQNGPDSKYDAKAIEPLFWRTATEFIARSIFENAHIEPAERIAINIFSKEISERRSNLIDELLNSDAKGESLELLNRKASRYSLPIRDSLQIAERLDVYKKNVGELSYLADELESQVLGGKIGVSSHGEVQFIANDSKAPLEIHLTGSMVKSLASITFYLRHIAKPGDFLIIDEPELTLHPDNQRKVARILARVVNAGVKVLISTHSDYIIRELNNLMMLNSKGNDKEVLKLGKKFGYKKEEFLDFEKVGAYLFGEDVEELDVSEIGFEVPTIDHEINSLNEAASEIFLDLHLG